MIAMPTHAQKSSPIALLFSLALLASAHAGAQTSATPLAAAEAGMAAEARAAAGWAVQAMRQCLAIGMPNLTLCANSPGPEVAAPGIAMAAIQMRADFLATCSAQIHSARCMDLFEQALAAETQKPPQAR